MGPGLNMFRSRAMVQLLASRPRRTWTDASAMEAERLTHRIPHEAVEVRQNRQCPVQVVTGIWRRNS